MADRNIDIALRIKADLEAAQAEIQRLNKTVDQLGTSSQATGGAIGATAKQIEQVGRRADETSRELNAAGTRLRAFDRDNARVGMTSKQTAQAMRLLPAQITDIVTGLASGQPVFQVAIQQGGQLRDSFGGITPALRGMGQMVASVFTPMRLLIAGVGGTLAAFAVAAYQGAQDQEALNRELIATGEYAGITAGELHTLSVEIGGSADQALRLLVASGRVSREGMEQAARAAVNLATVTGKSIDDAVQDIIKLRDDPVRAIRELDSTYHLLTLAQYEHIKALAEEGNAEAAATAAQDAAAREFDRRASEIRNNLGLIDRAWAEVRESAGAAWDAMKGVGRTKSNTDIYDEANRQLTAIKSRLPQTRGFSDNQLLQAARSPSDPNHAFFAGDLGLIQQLLQQKSAASAGRLFEQWQAKTDADHQRLMEESKRASDVMNSYLQAAKTDEAKAAEIAKVKDATAKLIAGNPGNRAKYEADEKTALASIAKRYADRPDRTGQREAEAQARAAAAAQQGLLQSIQQLQGQLDPAAAAWVRYNQTVTEANQQAEQAKKAPGANAAAIDAERNAVVALAKTIRDADLDKIAEQDRKAWEQLRQSLRTPTEVSVETAEAQIKQLNDLLARGVINARQYHDSVKRIGESSVLAAPQYQGVDAAVGGVSSELSRNFEAQRALDDWHTQQLAANEAFRAEDEANEEAYQARKAAIEQQYADQRLNIEQSRQQLTLTASSDFFGQLAVLQQSSNRKIATIGKAAAIAKAMIDTYQSATAAYAAMASIPYVGPALGAAAAAAAIAAGLANVAQIRSQPTGYATGGEIRGPGTGTSDSIPIWASNGEFMQRAAAVQYYGVDFMQAVNEMRLPKKAFADGGLIGVADPQAVFADAPRLSAPVSPRMSISSGPSEGQGGRPVIHQKHVHVWDRNQAAEEIASTHTFEEAVLHVVGDNPTRIRGRWNS